MNSGIPFSRNGLRRLLLPALALGLSLVLLGAGINGLSGGTKEAVAAPLAEPAAPFDLAITKSHLPITFTVGSGNIYFINVSRTNTETINQAVLLEDNLPSGLTWTPVAAIGKWNCSTSTSTKVSCFYTEANPTNFDQISFSVNVPADIVPNSVTNVAQLIVTDAITTNNVFADITPINKTVSLAISKSANVTNAHVGESVYFDIQITNNGDVAVNTIQVTDVLDSALTYESCAIDGNASSCSYNSTTRTVSRTISSLAPSTSTTIRIYTRVNSTVTATDIASNYATLAWGIPQVSIDSNTVSVQLEPAADLRVTKTDNLSYVQAGQNVVYTIKVANIGSTQATGVFIEDTLVSYPNLTWVSINKNGLSLTEVISTTSTGRWLLNDFLDPGEEVTFYITARVAANASGVITNQASVFSTLITDYNTSNNSAQDNDNVLTTNNDVVVTKSVAPDPNLDGIFYVGEPVTFVLQVSNESAALTTFTFVTVNDVLPSTLDFISCSVENGSGYCSYNSSNRNVQTLIYSLPPDPDVFITITVRVNNTVISPRTVSNSGSVVWLSNTRVSNTVTINVAPAADLVAGKTDGVTEVLPNSFITYTVSITNSGSILAIGVSAVDTLGPNLSLKRVIRTGLESATLVTTTNSVYLTNLPVLAPGAKISFKVVALVSSAAPVGSTVTNYIEASTTTPEYRGALDRNTATDTDTVVAAPAVTIKKTTNDNTVDTNETFAFTILVQNSGSVAVNNLVVTDNIPTVLDITDADSDKGTLTTSGRTVTVKVTSLAAGAQIKIVIVVKVNSTAVAKEKYTNVAKMTYDPNYSQQDDASFRIGKGSTLPGTGFGKQEDTPAGGLVGLALGIGGVLGLLGLGALIYAAWARRHRPDWARWLTGIGLILILSSAVFGCAGVGIRAATSPSAPVAAAPSQESILFPPPSQAVVLNTPTAGLNGSQGEQPTGPSLPTAASEPTATLHPVEQQIANFEPTPTPETLPDYAIPTPAVRPTLGPNGIPADDSPVTRIVIPAMNLDTLVKFVPYSGETWLIGGLRWEIAWMGDTSWPGLGGNTGLAGHVDFADGSAGPFWNLNSLKRGDEVVLYTQKNIFIYQVREQKIVDDYDMSVIDATDNAQITLITCTEWDRSLNLYLKRLIVFADLVDVRPLS